MIHIHLSHIYKYTSTNLLSIWDSSTQCRPRVHKVCLNTPRGTEIRCWWYSIVLGSKIQISLCIDVFPHYSS